MGPERLRQRVRRGGWVLLDQALASGTNFAAGLVAARALGPASFGRVAIAMSAAYLAIGAHRALVGEPALACLPMLAPPDGRTPERDALAAAAGIGLVAGALCVAVSSMPVALTGEVRWMAVWLPAVVAQDGVRYLAFARRRPELAVTSDAAWAVGQGVALAVVVLGKATAASLIAAWGVGALLGATVGMWLLEVTPWRGRPVRWLRRSWSLSGWLLPQTALSHGSLQLSTVMVGGLLGAEAVGGFRALYSLVMPVGAAVTAVVALLVPTMAVGLQAQGPRGLSTLIRSLSLQAGLLGLVAAAVLVVWSAAVVRLAFGPGYARFHSLVLPMAGSMVLQAVGLPLGAGLRALRDGRRIFLAQLFSTSVGPPALLLLGLAFGIEGAAWSVPLQAAAMTAAAAVLYRPAVRDYRARGGSVDAPVDSHAVA